MGSIRLYVELKENESLEIAKRTEQLFLKELDYQAALRKAKEEFSREQSWTTEELLQREA